MIYNIEFSQTDILKENVTIASEGSTVRASCKSNGYPQPEFYILPEDERKLDSSHNYSEVVKSGYQSEIILEDISRENHVSNFCVAKLYDFSESFKLVSSIKSVAVRYLDTPKVIVNSEKIINKINDQNTSPEAIIEIHSNANLTCQTEASDAIEYKFFKDGVELPNNDLFGDTIFIESAGYEDSGAYSCEAKNDVLVKKSGLGTKLRWKSGVFNLCYTEINHKCA